MSKSKDYDDWIATMAANLDKVELAEDVDAEACDVMICRIVTDPLLMPDNLVGPCTKCFKLVQFRPALTEEAEEDMRRLRQDGDRTR